jgi:hypothetical protein
MSINITLLYAVMIHVNINNLIIREF